MMLNELISTITNRGLSLIGLGESGSIVTNAEQLLELCDLMMSNQDEASGIALSQEILTSYRCMERDNREHFLELLNGQYGPDVEAIEQAAAAFAAEGNRQNRDQLSQSLKSRCYHLLVRLGQSPGAIQDLVNMRADLLTLQKKQTQTLDIDGDFVELFTIWFNRGFLELRRIDWNTPANILEKIIHYEAVHGIDGWDELRARLDPADRRIYAFFHPCLEDEPLIFVEVALTRGIPDSIEKILLKDRQVLDPKSANTATFYSISNCQHGLRGIPLGNFLIKQVVEDLNNQHRNLADFVTLSPVPTLSRWMRKPESEHFDPNTDLADLIGLTGIDHDPEQVFELPDKAKKELLSMTAWFLRHAKRSNGQPFDPVASFHLGNGARLERINWGADPSQQAMEHSLGIMVNYRYLRDEIEKNHRAFANGEPVAAAPEVIRLERTFTTKISRLEPTENAAN